MNKFILLHLFCLLTTYSIFSQDMNQGFNYLENGAFEKAEFFFKNILNEYPNNKTARLCYARALGLNKNPEKSLSLFTKLLDEYPKDLEIQLNYAESLLWNKKFTDAQVYYQNLVNENKENFVAHLGYANTLSNLKQFQKADSLIRKAISLSPNNQGAKISKKYILLGYANEKIKDQEYLIAENFYNEILNDFPEDKETLLNKANLYLITKKYKKAQKNYEILLKKHPNMGLNGVSLTSHLLNKDKKSLKFAQQSSNQLNDSTDFEIQKQTKERFVQSLIWNKKYKIASDSINLYKNKYGNQNWILALDATLNIYKNNFKLSSELYENILINDSTSFDGNLGLANAQFAMGKTREAITSTKKTLLFHEKQNDALQFLKKIEFEHIPYIDETFTTSFDNGDNNARSLQTLLEFPLHLNLKIYGKHQNRKTENSFTKKTATTNDFIAGFNYKIAPLTYFFMEGGITNASSFSKNYSKFIMHSGVKTKPGKLQDLEIGFKREMQNFNTDLILKEISTNHGYANYNISTNYNLGWFTQYYFTTQSDKNTRHLAFTSLYYNFIKKPYSKIGINYQYINFKKNVPLDYFSPRRFNAFELFIDVIENEKTIDSKSFYFHFNTATGYQFIESNEKQWTYRIQGKIGYKFSNQLYLNIFGSRSNIASTTAAGFTYNELGARLKWYFSNKSPIKIFRD